jgi:hypothetical protein
VARELLVVGAVTEAELDEEKREEREMGEC